MNKIYSLFVIILLLYISFFVGQYIYKIGKIDKEILLAKEEITQRDLSKEVSRVAVFKTSPNALLIFKTEYLKCGHILNEYMNIQEKHVNLTKEEFQEQYLDWQVIHFSEKEIVLLKKVDESCKQHYILKERNGHIAIYYIDEEGDIILRETTAIATKYLTELDIKKLKSGIRVNGLEELNSKLEDFE